MFSQASFQHWCLNVVVFLIQVKRVRNGQAQVQVRCRSGSGQVKRKKLKDLDLSYTLNLVYSYSRLLIAYSRLLPSTTNFTAQLLAPYSSVNLFSHLLTTPNSNFSATCSTLPFKYSATCSQLRDDFKVGIEPLALLSPKKLFSHLLPNQEGLQTLRF